MAELASLCRQLGVSDPELNFITYETSAPSLDELIEFASDNPRSHPLELALQFQSHDPVGFEGFETVDSGAPFDLWVSEPSYPSTCIINS